MGQAYFKSDAVAGQNIYLCTAANTWTQVQGGSSGGSWNMKPDLSYTLLRMEGHSAWNVSPPAAAGDFVFTRQSGTQGLNALTGATDGRPGVFGFSTTTTSGNRSLWHAQFSPTVDGANSLYARTNKDWEMVFVFRYRDATDYAASTYYAGLMTVTGDSPPFGCGVRYIAGTDTNLMLYTANANLWGSLIDTGIAPDTNWHKVRLRSDGTATRKMWISIDGGTERSICVSGCDMTLATTQEGAMTSFGINITTNEAVQKVVQLDYLHLWMNWGAR